MRGLQAPREKYDEGEWVLDNERGRMVNRKFFDFQSQAIYQPELFQGRLRPDVTQWGEGAFHRKLSTMHGFRQTALVRFHSEMMRYRLYSGMHEPEGYKVALTNIESQFPAGNSQCRQSALSGSNAGP
jgi:hypothetical protein